VCLAIPGKIEEIFEEQGLKMARVSFGGVRKSVCLQYTPDVAIGKFVLVHVGFAIGIIDEDEARKTLELLDASEMKAELEPSASDTL
jgi:hydrogenase expression/formation protein HypC